MKAVAVIVFLVLFLFATYLAKMTEHVFAGYAVGALAFAVAKALWRD